MKKTNIDLKSLIINEKWRLFGVFKIFIALKKLIIMLFGVSEGIRTPDPQSHNLMF